MKIDPLLVSALFTNYTMLSTTLNFSANLIPPVLGVISTGGGISISYCNNPLTSLTSLCWAAVNMFVPISNDFFFSFVVLSFGDIALKKLTLFLLLCQRLKLFFSTNTDCRYVSNCCLLSFSISTRHLFETRLVILLCSVNGFPILDEVSVSFLQLSENRFGVKWTPNDDSLCRNLPQC